MSRRKALAATIPVFLCLAMIAALSLPVLAMWEPTGNPLMTGEGDQLPVAAVSDGNEGAIAIIGDIDWAKEEMDLYAQRIDRYGNPVWPTGGILVSKGTGGSDLWTSVAASDGSGGAVIVWCGEGSKKMGVFAQRLDASGNKMWGSGGITVCDREEDQKDPLVISDGAGG